MVRMPTLLNTVVFKAGHRTWRRRLLVVVTFLPPSALWKNLSHVNSCAGHHPG